MQMSSKKVKSADGKRNPRPNEWQGVAAPMTPWSARLFDETREPLIRHYVWGTVIVVMGLFTLFGIWFLFGG